MVNEQPARLFISHSHADNAFGVRLAEDLRHAIGDELSVWYDVSGGLHGGDAWWRKIVQEIAARPVFIVVLSPDATESRWVNDEIDLAWNLKNTPAGKTILPVMCRACDPRADLRTRHIISFLPPRSYESALAEVLVALGVHAPAAGAQDGAATGASQGSRASADVIDQLAAQIEAAYASQDWPNVVRKAEFLMRKAPQRMSGATQRMLGIALLEEGTPDRARETLDAAVALDPMDLDSLRAAARVAVAVGDAASAHTFLDDALALASDAALRLRLLADDAYALRLARDHTLEVRRCDEALRLAPDDMEWNARRVVALALAGRYSDAQAAMDHLTRAATTRLGADSAPHLRAQAQALHHKLGHEAHEFSAATAAREREASAERFADLLTRNASTLALQVDPLSPQRKLTPRLPERLASLGYLMRPFGTAEAIFPPLCDALAGRRLLSDGAGWSADARAQDLPHQWVTLPAYQIARFPVTVAEYACFVRASGRTPQRWEASSQRLDWSDQLKRPDHPVVCVTWHDALAYAAWLSSLDGQRWRLPTEAEWESAARWDEQTGKARAYPWGDAFDPARCNCATAIGMTTPVGSYPDGASPCGALDMSGNVWEWTSNLADDSAEADSAGREPADIAMLRGGSWFSGPGEVSGVARRAHLPNGYSPAIGFRLVCAPRRG